MDTLGRHLLAEYFDCDREVLEDLDAVERLLNDAARAAQVKVVASRFHRFRPHGVTGVVIVEESHLSVHTWPEAGYAAADFFTCGEGHPDRAHEVLAQGLGAARSEVMRVRRGVSLTGQSMEVVNHHSERHKPPSACTIRPAPRAHTGDEGEAG